MSWKNGQRESDWIFGWPTGDGIEPPDQRTDKSFIRICSRVRDRADSLVGTIAETIGPQVSEALTLVTHPESRLAGSSLQIYWSQKPDKRFVKILKSVGKLLIYWLPGTDYSALRASPLRGRPSGVQLGLAAKLSNRACFMSAVRIAAEKQALPKIGF